ncbi:hypothetical protein J4H86_01975 [Spiractinospora alimapuensis]|uniref:YciI family protein n=1 Tax=Spiractinospora alimapuensis TaxID=2820884 RepID=UPI001F2F26B4|nr:YciI family protein [Spiractinospora alimapuensis]QVQ52629.1 hypothetical protein J4H86_01975 [Spiractinospora alimapuensis]
MRYLMLVCGAPEEWAHVTEAASEREMEGIIAWAEKWIAEGKLDVGGELTPPEQAKTIRLDADGTPQVTDGPYLELKEIIGGISYIVADSLEEALSVAATFPGLATCPSNSVEVRPIIEH